MYGNFIDEDKFLKYLHTNGSPNAFWNGCSKKEVKELIFLMNSFIMIYPKCSEVFSMEAIMGKQFGNIVTLRSIYFSEDSSSIILEKYPVTYNGRKEYIIKLFSCFTACYKCRNEYFYSLESRGKTRVMHKIILSSVLLPILLLLEYYMASERIFVLFMLTSTLSLSTIIFFSVYKVIDFNMDMNVMKKRLENMSRLDILQKRMEILEKLQWEELMNPIKLYKNKRTLYMDFFALNMKQNEFIKDLYSAKGFDMTQWVSAFLMDMNFENITIGGFLTKDITIQYPEKFQCHEEIKVVSMDKDSVQEIPDIKEESLDDLFTKGLQSVMKNIEDLDLYSFSEKKPFQEIAKFTRMIHGQMKEMKGEISSISDEDKIRLTNYYFKQTITILDIIENNLRILNRGKVGLSTNEQKKTIQSSKEALETLCDVYSVVLNKRTIEEYDTLDVITTVLREKVEMDGFTKNGGEDA